MGEPSVEFSSEDAPASDRVSDIALKEQKAIESVGRRQTQYIFLYWKGGHITFNPNSYVPIFSLVALVLLLFTTLLVLLIGIWTPPGAEWLDKITSALGYGVTGIIGAMVGSAASSKKSDHNE